MLREGLSSGLRIGGGGVGGRLFIETRVSYIELLRTKTLVELIS